MSNSNSLFTPQKLLNSSVDTPSTRCPSSSALDTTTATTPKIDETTGWDTTKPLDFDVERDSEEHLFFWREIHEAKDSGRQEPLYTRLTQAERLRQMRLKDMPWRWHKTKQSEFDDTQTALHTTVRQFKITGADRDDITNYDELEPCLPEGAPSTKETTNELLQDCLKKDLFSTALPDNLGPDGLNFKALTKVQHETISRCCRDPEAASPDSDVRPNGFDAIILAPNGHGKTAAYIAAMVSSVHKQLTDLNEFPYGGRAEMSNGAARPYGLLLLPTRELAGLQMNEMFDCLTAGMRLRVQFLHGGKGTKQEQAKSMLWSADILVATPGRLQDFVRKGLVDLNYVRCMVVDEADTMVAGRGKSDQGLGEISSGGFDQQVGVIWDYIQRYSGTANGGAKMELQTLFFSSAFSKKARSSARKFMRPGKSLLDFQTYTMSIIRCARLSQNLLVCGSM